MSDALVLALPPLPPAIWARRPVRKLPYPLEERGCALTARARHGLWRAVRGLGLEPGQEVLAPAYHHGSEIEALARAGLACRFYEATSTLEPDEAELESLTSTRTRALHLVHYLGFPQDSSRWRRFCDERGLVLLEDAAQAWLATFDDGRPAGSLGDAAIFCLYKTFGVPDGAATISRVTSSRATRGAVGASALAVEHALWLATRTPVLSRLAETIRRERPYDPQLDFALGDPGTPPRRSTTLALRRIADAGAAEARRRNYRALLESLSDRVLSAFAQLPPGASPFVFPLLVDDKAGLLRRLAARRIRAVDLWSTPHPSLRRDAFPAAAALRETVVGLPVHQELRAGDLERILDVVA